MLANNHAGGAGGGIVAEVRSRVEIEATTLLNNRRTRSAAARTSGAAAHATGGTNLYLNRHCHGYGGGLYMINSSVGIPDYGATPVPTVPPTPKPTRCRFPRRRPCRRRHRRPCLL